jgi:uncharacterized spore protein YtfJ
MGNLNSNLEALFKNMENFVSTKTVVGEPMNVGDNIILPLVDVSFGVGAGTTDSKQEKESVAGGLGAKISPSAVIVINNDNVQLVNIKNQNNVSKLIDMVPGIVSKLDFSSKFKKNNDKDETFEDEKITRNISEEENE